MPRTITVTMEVLVDHLPAHEIDDIAEYAAEEDMTEEQAAACVLSEAGAGEVAECLMLGTLDPDIFGGSMLYLKVVQAKVTAAKWQS